VKPGAISYLPMNKITEYIDAMPLSDIEKAALPDDIRAVHRAGW
jgi:membrane glycosyltransferase